MEYKNNYQKRGRCYVDKIIKNIFTREDTTIDEQVKSLKKLIQDGYINCNSLFQINIDSILEPNIPKANKDILKESINIIKELEICKKETGTGKRKSRKKHKTKKHKTKKHKTKKNKTKKNKTKKHKTKNNLINFFNFRTFINIYICICWHRCSGIPPGIPPAGIAD